MRQTGGAQQSSQDIDTNPSTLRDSTGGAVDCYRGLVVMQRNAGSTGARKLLAHIRIPTALAILSLAIYLCAALLLYQQEQGGSAYIVERSSLAAAVSKVAHGTPFGAVFSDTMASFET